MLNGSLTIRQGPGAQHKKNQPGKHSDGWAKECRDNCWRRDSKSNNENMQNPCEFLKDNDMRNAANNTETKGIKTTTHLLGCLLISTGVLARLRWKFQNPASLQWRMSWLWHIYMSTTPWPNLENCVHLTGVSSQDCEEWGKKETKNYATTYFNNRKTLM